MTGDLQLWLTCEVDAILTLDARGRRFADNSGADLSLDDLPPSHYTFQSVYDNYYLRYADNEPFLLKQLLNTQTLYAEAETDDGPVRDIFPMDGLGGLMSRLECTE